MKVWPNIEPYSVEHKRYYEHVTQVEAPKVRDGKFIVTEPWEVNAQGLQIRVPMGFITDVASIPLGVQALLRTRSDGWIRPAAVAHDYLYLMQRVGADKVSKRKADRVFKELMEARGVRLSELLYRGVMLGGHLVWHRDRSPEREYVNALVDWSTPKPMRGTPKPLSNFVKTIVPASPWAPRETP